MCSAGSISWACRTPASTTLTASVNGCNLVPEPPARIMPFIGLQRVFRFSWFSLVGFCLSLTTLVLFQAKLWLAPGHSR